jgi:hypothetical protein
VRELSYANFSQRLGAVRCEEARDLVSPLVDDELVGERKRTISDHVSSSSACKGLAEDYRRIGKELKAAYEPAPCGPP